MSVGIEQRGLLHFGESTNPSNNVGLFADVDVERFQIGNLDTSELTIELIGRGAHVTEFAQHIVECSLQSMDVCIPIALQRLFLIRKRFQLCLQVPHRLTLIGIKILFTKMPLCLVHSASDFIVELSLAFLSVEKHSDAGLKILRQVNRNHGRCGVSREETLIEAAHDLIEFVLRSHFGTRKLGMLVTPLADTILQGLNLRLSSHH